MKPLTFRKFAPIVVVGFMLTGGAASLIGQESAAMLRPQLPLWSDGEAVALHTRAVDLQQRATASITQMTKHKDRQQLLTIKLQEVNRTCVRVMQLRRCADHMKLWGEPAAIELQIMARRLDESLGGLYAALKSAHSKTLENIFPRLVTLCNQRKKILDHVQQLIDADRLEDAEQEFLPVYDELASFARWYNGKLRESTVGPFDTLYGRLSDELQRQRAERIGNDIALLMADRMPDYSGLAREVHEASAGVREQGVGKSGKKSLAGPDLMRRFGDRWQKQHLATIHCLALVWSHPRRGTKERLAIQHSAGCEEMTQALVALIDADAARATSEQVPQLYGDYLDAMTPLALLGQESLLGRFTPALKRLASKCPEFAAEVAAYRVVTSETLRWRSRIAECQARVARGDFESLKHNERHQQALVTLPAEMVATAESDLRGKKLLVSKLLASSEGDELTSPFLVDGVYTRVGLPPGLTSAVARLESDLMIDKTHPPLTLEAAVALEAARRGNALEIGGEVAGVGLQSLIELMYSATGKQCGLVRLDSLPMEPSNVQVVWDCKQVRLRLDLVPRWVRQEYLFVDLR